MSDLFGVLTNNFPEFAAAFWVTCQIVGLSFVVAMVVGTVVAAFRVAPVRALNWIGTVYVETFRNTPLLVLAIIFFAGVLRAGVSITERRAGVLALGLYTAAYIAEALRSGVYAVSRGQIEASLSLGFTYSRTLRRIILPQAFRTVIPPLGNLVIAMIKNSAIIGGSLIAVDDILHEARQIQNNNAQTVETFFWAGVGYLILTITATVIVRRLETRLAIRR